MDYGSEGSVATRALRVPPATGVAVAYERVWWRAARTYARMLAQIEDEIVTGAPRVFVREARHFLRRCNGLEEDALPSAADIGSTGDALALVERAWPGIQRGETTAAQALAQRPGLWEAIHASETSAALAELAAQQLVRRRWLRRRVLEVGAGCSLTTGRIIEHIEGTFFRTDRDEAALGRFPLPVRSSVYDFDQPGELQHLDTIFGVDCLHRAQEKTATLAHFHRMLRPGGVVLIAEFTPTTTPDGQPMALGPFFHLFDGVWDRGGFPTRDEWLALLSYVGFCELGYQPLDAGRHDLGGLVWGIK